jgi:hypothetical protein
MCLIPDRPINCKRDSKKIWALTNITILVTFKSYHKPVIWGALPPPGSTPLFLPRRRKRSPNTHAPNRCRTTSNKATALAEAAFSEAT